jgi:hypothetical protein
MTGKAPVRTSGPGLLRLIAAAQSADENDVIASAPQVRCIYVTGRAAHKILVIFVFAPFYRS